MYLKNFSDALNSLKKIHFISLLNTSMHPRLYKHATTACFAWSVGGTFKNDIVQSPSTSELITNTKHILCMQMLESAIEFTKKNIEVNTYWTIHL